MPDLPGSPELHSDSRSGSRGLADLVLLNANSLARALIGAAIMDDLSSFATTLTGRYEIEREIGRGGMATVYLARDLRHDRLVALKVFNPELGAVLGAERFLAEIKVTANLQHPNLLPLFDSGEANGQLFYVMPFVEGESLRHRLTRERQLPVDEAVRIANAIAGALDHAHRHGVIHRDLKPENVLLHEGVPMVMDFGIALAVSNAAGARMTQTGLSLGTPQYMSPEQATGDRIIDARTDIYSLAALLYEMLTGDPPHLGSTAQAVIAKVLTEKPTPVHTVRDTVPGGVSAAINRALAKLPADRFATARAFADALQAKSDMVRPPRRTTSMLGTWSWIAALSVAVVLGLLGTFWPRDIVRPGPVRFLVDPVRGDPASQGMALAPDGSAFVYAGANELLVRSMSQVGYRSLPTPKAPSAPSFSPDGKWIVFDHGGTLAKVPAAGGVPSDIADSIDIDSGPSWGTAGRIAFTDASLGLVSVSETGSDKRTLTRPTGGDIHLWPHYLPDGKSLLFAIWHGSMQTMEIAVLAPDGAITRLVRGTSPRFSNGSLVYAHEDGSLWSAGFDPTHRRLTSEERPTGETTIVVFKGASDYAVSPSGALVYYQGTMPNQPVLVDRAGVARALSVDPRTYARPRFSPDGRRIAMDTRSGGHGDIWIHDIAAVTTRRLTGGEDVHQPEWSPDGQLIAFTAILPSTGEDLFTIPVDGSAPARVALQAPNNQSDEMWTPDGQSLVFVDANGVGIVRVEDHVRSNPFADLRGSAAQARVSPDGRWLAYASLQSGRPEAFVRRFSEGGAITQISSGGGTEPVWSRDSRHLFYRQDDKLIEATLTTNPTLAVSGRTLLFAQHFVSDGSHTFYDVSPDGKSFVFLKNAEEQARIMVVLNWK